MFKVIEQNLSKFAYRPHCGLYRYYVYENIKIGLESPLIIFDEYKLYIDEEEIRLNIFERWKLKRIYMKLEKMRNDSYKNKIKSALT